MSRRGAVLRHKWGVVDGLLIHERTAGSARGRAPVLLVHGLGVASRALAPFASLLAGEFEVHVPDQPGFGRSAHPSEILDTVGLASFLGQWCEANALGPVLVIGNSFGCQIAAEFAARHPAGCRALVLQGPTTDPAMRSRTGLILHWLLNSRREPGHVFRLGRDYVRAGMGRILATFEEVIAYEIERSLPLIRVPTLVVRGNRDPLVSSEWAAQVTSLLPRGRLITVPGAAHSMTQFWPLELLRVTRPFLLSPERVYQ